MGSGKGKVEFWVCPVKAEAVLFEIAVGSAARSRGRRAFAELILKLASYKLPIKTRFIERE
jgi:ribosomal protein L16/L10AE